MNGLVEVGKLAKEYGQTYLSQLALLRKYNIRSAASMPHGRGYSHYITPEDAERLRLLLQKNTKRRHSYGEKRPAPAPAPVQFHLDSIECKETFWSRAKQAFNVLVGR